ncbi:MAG: DNA-3-methyladenine glycosylase 2 family protein [Chloroflexi bacterium]|nr:DNA-3-methyladenine glycosylase 2 family protein [Chloroflexota bacterium]
MFTATTSSHRVVLTPRGDFSLAAGIRFLRGFTPLSYDDQGHHAQETLRLAFPVAGHWGAVGISAHQSDAGRVTATVRGADDVEQVRRQLETMLSLDVDASSLPDIVSHDDVAADLVRQFRGLRPICFASPYEAGAWAVLSQRIQMKQAARIRVRMCEELGTAVDVDGATLYTFPDPETLRRTTAVGGLPAVKVDRLHAIADAALDGRLDAATLRAAGPDQALADLQRLPGIGPFGADLVLIRGAGEPDHFPRAERRLHGAMADAYGVDAGDVDALEAIAATWSPFRSWIAFLFRTRSSMAMA